MGFRKDCCINTGSLVKEKIKQACVVASVLCECVCVCVCVVRHGLLLGTAFPIGDKSCVANLEKADFWVNG